MIQQLTSLNITQELINATKYQQISGITTQPYFLTGNIITFGVMILLWFMLGFMKVTKDTMAFSSWIWKAMGVIIALGALVHIAIFIFPTFAYWI